MSFTMRILISIQIMAFLYLQGKLWSGEGSVAEIWQLQDRIEIQQQENQKLKARNALSQAEVMALKEGYDAVEERARIDLGMIKDDETFFLLVD